MEIGEKSVVPHKHRVIACSAAIFYIVTLFPFSAFALEVSEGKRTRALVEAAFTGEKKSALIRAEEGGEVRLGRASIVIPPGALKKDTEISITRLFRVAETGERLYNATEGRGGYRFLPAGQQFEKEVVITIPYEEALSGKRAALEELKTYFYDTKKKVWTALPRRALLEEEGLIESESTHFTDMINGTLALPETADPLDFNINSIKNLEAANPLSGIVSVQGLEGGNSGDAQFQMELPLPPGVRGMAAHVALTYSSGGGGGFVGKGFDINYGSVITTDTRFGLPKYAGNDRYMLDGIVLSKKADGDTREKQNPLAVSFEAEKQSAYRTITAYKENEGEHAPIRYWTVREANGTMKTYGCKRNGGAGFVGDEASCQYDPAFPTHIYSWYVQSETDVYGNSVDYEYESKGNYIYPKQITYGGGAYRIVFEYTSGVRKDIRVDGRATFPIKCTQLLKEIRSEGRNAPGDGFSVIKRYGFEYEASPIAHTTLLSKFIVSGRNGGSYGYRFSYKKPEKKASGEYIVFGSGKLWGEGKPLQVGNSTTTSTSFSTSAGVGVGTPVVDGRVTSGINGSYSETTGYSDYLLADIDGDGKADSVRQKDATTLGVYFNTGSGFEKQEQEIQLDRRTGGLPQGLESNGNTSFNYGWNIYGGAGLATPVAAQAGVTYTETYHNGEGWANNSITDVDGDGRADILISKADYYLKNTKGEGDSIYFKAVPFTDIGSGRSVQGYERALSKEDMRKYESAFYVQTPFRAWRAPYSGVIKIGSSFRREQKSDHTAVRMCIYQSTAASPVSTSVFEAKDESGACETEVSVREGEYIYFITQRAEAKADSSAASYDPKGTDISWGITIAYTALKAFERKYDGMYVFAPTESLRQQNSVIGKLYDPKGDDEEKVYTLKDDWFEIAAADSAITDALIQNGHGLPEKFTFQNPEITEERLEGASVEVHGAQEKAVTRRIKQYLTYCVSGGYYHIQDMLTGSNAFIGAQTLMKLFKSAGNYSIGKATLDETYELYGIRPTWEKARGENKKLEASYSLESGAFTVTSRARGKSGSVYGNIVYLPSVIDETSGIRHSLSVDTKKKAVYEDMSTVPSSTYSYAEDTDGNIIISDTKNELTFRLKEKASFPSMLEKAEMEQLMSAWRYVLPESDIASDFYGKRRTTGALTAFFGGMKIEEGATLLDAERIERIIKNAFNKKTGYIDSEKTILSKREMHESVSKKTLAYERILAVLSDKVTEWKAMGKSESALSPLTALLTSQKAAVENATLSYTDENAYALYTALDIPTLYAALKDAVRAVDAQYHVPVFQEGKPYERTDYYERKAALSGKTISEINEELHPYKLYRFYTEALGNCYKATDGGYVYTSGGSGALSALCSKLGMYAYGSYSMRIGYKKEGLYAVREGAVGLLTFAAGSDTGNILSKRTDPGKVTWNFSEDFSIDTKTAVKSADPEKRITTDEILYGRGNWYYGVWIGNPARFDVRKVEPERNGAITDKKSAIEKDPSEYEKKYTDKDADDIAKGEQDAFEGKDAGNKLKGAAGIDDMKEASDKLVPYYLPDNDEALSKLYEGKRMGGIEGRQFRRDVIYGHVTQLNEAKRSFDAEEKGTIVQAVCYCPFIDKEGFIHADRMGGSAYDKLPKPSNSSAASFTMPFVRKNKNDGKDTVTKAELSVSFPGNAQNFFNLFKGAIQDTSAYFDFFSRGAIDTSKDEMLLKMLGGSLSTDSTKTEGSADTMQSVQDINGDGIPDIVYCTENGLTVYEGVRKSRSENYLENSETPFIGFTQSAFSAPITTLGSNRSNPEDTTTVGGMITPNGVISFLRSATGKEIGRTFNVVQANGISLSRGKSKTTCGFIDINGDGLPDYLNEGGLLFNTGNSLKNYSLPEQSPFSPGAFGAFGTSKNSSMAGGLSLTFGKGPQAATSSASSLTSGPSVNVGVTYSVSAENTEELYTDINGDGLPDRICKANEEEAEAYLHEHSAYGGDKEKSWYLKVYYNLGDRFDAATYITIPKWDVDTGTLITLSTKADGSIWNGTLVESIPGVKENTQSTAFLNPFAFNKDIFSAYADTPDLTTTLTLGVSGNVSVNVNAGIQVWFITINITGDVNTGMGGSTSLSGVSVRMQDMDGDGLADRVLRIPGEDGGLYVQKNLLGNIDALETIALPSGGRYDIEYCYKSGTVRMPQGKYVMSAVVKSDGKEEESFAAEGKPLTSKHRYRTEYLYKDGYYDRIAKESYGYGTVRASTADSTTTTEYSTGIYKLKGEVIHRTTKGKAEAIASEEKTEYEKVSEDGNTKRALVLQQTHVRTEGEKTQKSEKRYRYDSYSNVIGFREEGEASKPIRAELRYTEAFQEEGVYNLVDAIAVYDREGKLLRKREATYEREGRAPVMSALRQYYTEREAAETTLTYYANGNIRGISDGVVTKEYDYDGYGLFVTKIRQRGKGGTSYESSTVWDIAGGGLKLSETDINGNVMRYVYDTQQRLIEVRSPYDTGGVPAVRYRYYTPEDGFWYAVTENKVVTDANNTETIKTFIQTDGLGRAIISAKTGCTYNKEKKVKEVGWNVSGAVCYDEKGRTIAEGQPYFIAGESTEAINLNGKDAEKRAKLYQLIRPTKKAYDALDRIVETVLPGVNEKGNKRVQKICYGITDEGLSYTETTDPKGNIGVQYADARENIVRVERYSEKDTVHPLTSATYEYDAMGQMVAAYDAARNPITVMYDMLGRKTELTTKDGGAKRYTYDALHLLYEDDEVMRQSGSRIDYTYDGFNRVIKIEYPEGGDVEYEYGIPISERDAKTNAAGKVISVRDEAGETRYEYGKLGEVVKETRTLQRHIPAYESEKTAVMEYVSDYLGRMQSITYPDREVVTYGYDAGGQVCSITGERDGRDYTYVADIRYDEYGQRVYIKYGNGVETNYTYDENMRWLKHIDTENKYGTQYQNINYSFDDVGNVLGYENDCMNGARYSTEQTYTYDALYQLIKAEGVTEDNPYAIPGSPDYRSNYEQNFSFDAIGNMTYKKSKETITPAKQKSGGDDLNYEFTYQYDADYAHRLKRAGSEQKGWRYYTYDANGNVTSESDGVAPNEDTTTLTPVTVTTHTNEAGESVYEADYAWAWPWSDSDTGSGKVSPNNKRIYEWNSRNLLMRSVALGYDTRYAYSADGNRAAKWTAGNLSETLYFNTMWTWHIEKGLSQEQQGQYSKHIYLGETRLVTKQTSDLEENYGQSEEKRHQYYYHPDHLGSAQLITDYEGNEYQRIEYTPYGELWVEKKTAHEKDMRYLPYKFTAKEQDEETGLYYYGARYLDAKYSRWMSTDPAVSDYIPIAPVNDEAKKRNQSLPANGVFETGNLPLYNYARNNPVKYTDPDGRIAPLAIAALKVLGSGAISAGVNYGAQVTKNFIHGKRGAEAFTDVNVGEMAGAFVQGIVGGVLLPGVSNAAGTAAKEFIKKGIQMAGSGIVAAIGSIPATIAENGVNNLINGTDTPLTEGAAENAAIAYVSGVTGGALVPQSPLPEINVKTSVSTQSAIRQISEEIIDAVRDQIIGDITKSLIKGNDQ